jgi:hypothetical protein
VTLHDPVFNQDLTYSAETVRHTLVAAAGDAGILGTPSLAVTQRGAGANMSVDVAAGRCILPGISGSYVCWSDAVENLVISAAPSSGNGRIDLIVARVRDAQATGSGSDNDWVLEVVAGTPASSPVAPSVPSYAIELARVTLTDATTSITDGIITNTRYHSASLADRVWPLVGVNAPSDNPAVTSSTESWGSVTIAAPNRQVKVFAWMSCRASTESGGSNGVPSLAIRLTHSGSTQVTTTPVYTLSASELNSVPLSRELYTTFTPTPGTDVVVEGRVQSVSGDDVDFFNGRLMVQVFPA